MKAQEILTKLNEAQYWEDYYPSRLNCNEAIEELEVFISNYQSIKSRLDNTVTTMATIRNDNISLVKILDKMSKEINDLKKENQYLKSRSSNVISPREETPNI